jgi:hypothetical protein
MTVRFDGRKQDIAFCVCLFIGFHLLAWAVQSEAAANFAFFSAVPMTLLLLVRKNERLWRKVQIAGPIAAFPSIGLATIAIIGSGPQVGQVLVGALVSSIYMVCFFYLVRTFLWRH